MRTLWTMDDIMNRIGKHARQIALLCALALLFSHATQALAEEYEYSDSDEYSYDESSETEAETEFIPQAYYEPVQTNSIAGWPEGQAIQAAAGIIMDLDSDTVLYAKNIDEKHYPASTTKIMTALVALENGKLDDVITCGEEVYDLEYDSSNIGLQVGEELSLKEMLYALMLASANDAANSIAVHYGGSLSGFADMMNAKAEELGCTNTHFTNPSGLHNDEHYTTARDLALIAEAAYENDTLLSIMSTKEYTIGETEITEEPRYLTNHHRMMQQDSDYYASFCTAGKTGYTSDAWNTLVTLGSKDDMHLVCVLLEENGAGRAYLETTDLMNYGFTNFYHLEAEGTDDTSTFYDIMGLNYPNAGTLVNQSDRLKERTVENVHGSATVPLGTSWEQLKKRVTEHEKGIYVCLFEDWPVGVGTISFNPLPTDIELEYQQYRDMDELAERSKIARTRKEFRETAIQAVNQIRDVSESAAGTAREYVKDNTLTVVLIGALVLAILLILITILVLRCTREARIQKKRRQEYYARMRMEDEIDRRSAAEIEEELRRAMEEEERQRREQEEKLRAEEEAERKLLETEELLRQINGSDEDGDGPEES